jgi:hypothetical protein
VLVKFEGSLAVLFFVLDIAGHGYVLSTSFAAKPGGVEVGSKKIEASPAILGLRFLGKCRQINEKRVFSRIEMSCSPYSLSTDD